MSALTEWLQRTEKIEVRHRIATTRTFGQREITTPSDEWDVYASNGAEDETWEGSMLASCPDQQTAELIVEALRSAQAGTWTPVADEDARSIIGEGVHTGLRKGTDAPEAHDLWVAISKSDEAWSDALDFFVWGLDQMDMALCKRSDDKRK